MTQAVPFLVDPAWLAARLGDEGVRILDASWYLPQQRRDGRAEYLAGHIPGAAYFDIDEVVDPSSTLPHTLPSAEAFAVAAGALGVGSGDTVVVYDGAGIFSAPRVWWMFRAFGHDRVAVLDGGLPAWKQAGYPLETGANHPEPRVFSAQLRPHMVRSRAAMLDNLAGRHAQVVDARSAARFAGSAPEPRPGVRAGHIPGSVNVPFERVLDERGRLLEADALRERFGAAGIDPARPIVASCGSGVTACVLALALHRIGAPDVAVYDGSWAEWGLPGETPVATGP